MLYVLSFAASGLTIVVLASHSPPSVTVLRVFAVKAALFEKAARGVARFDAELLGAARGGELFQRVGEHGARALPGRGRMHIEHVDTRIVGERSKADRGAAESRNQRQLAGKFCAEFFLDRRRPTPTPPAAPRCNRRWSVPRLRREKSPPAAAHPSAASAAARVLAERGRSSRDLPGGAVLGVLQHDAHFGEFVADAVGFLEVLCLARRIARFDQTSRLLPFVAPLSSMLGRNA